MKNCNRKNPHQFWAVATVCAAMASDFMYFTLGFIFYKYLSEKIETWRQQCIEDDEVTFKELWEMTDSDVMELQEESRTNAWKI